MASKSKLEELNLSRDEVKRLGEALKDEKFRKMLCEYAEEISDPENRRRYEEEILQMERDRGMDVAFIRPEPGYVLKTSVDGDKKAFINVSKSDKIDKPTSERKTNDDGKSGLMWHIPHSFAPPREDFDKEKKRCVVYDFVVHPDTYRMAESNDRFKKMVEDTAMDGIEKQFSVTLDRKNVKRPKMQFKGTPTATVIRNRNANGPQPPTDPTGLLKDMPYPYDEKSTQEKMKEREVKRTEEQGSKKAHKNATSNKENERESGATVPKYTIVHRSEVDMQEYRNAPDAKPSTRPRELVVKIELPLLKSAAEANLDIFEKRLLLESKAPAAYKLDLALPYSVDDSEGSAKFNKQKRMLVVTLPVTKEKLPSLPAFVNGGTSDSTEENGPVEKPLIEILPEVTKADSESELFQTKDPVIENGMESKGFETNAIYDKKMPVVHIAYTLPDFSFTQDAETVSFVLKIKNVSDDTIYRTSPTKHEVKLVCTSQGEGGFPIHFSLFLRFPEECGVVSEHCSVDATTDNVVLLLLKERSSRGIWDRFWVGVDADRLEEKLFLTTNNLKQQIEELHEMAGTNQAPVGPDPAVGQDTSSPPYDLQVTTMSAKKLTVKISPAKKGEDKKSKEEAEEQEDKEYDPPSSAEIEVVHTRPSPSLHSILKQRTVSESSEDVNTEGDSPRSPIDDEDELSSSLNSTGKRRSVSFSKHIDKATFKSSASVNSMKTSLKSKRKRQRKWEEKHDKASTRRRHNSTGSEGSGEEPAQSLSDSHSHSEEEAAVEEEKGNGDQSKSSDKPDLVLDFRTFPTPSGKSDSEAESSSPGALSKDKEEENNGDSCIKESKDETASNSTAKGDETSSSINHPVGDLVNGSSGKGSSIADKIKSKLAEVPKTSECDDSDDGEDGRDDSVEGCGQRQSTSADATYNEHRTECAFEFSNALMFDLDVE